MRIILCAMYVQLFQQDTPEEREALLSEDQQKLSFTSLRIFVEALCYSLLSLLQSLQHHQSECLNG